MVCWSVPCSRIAVTDKPPSRALDDEPPKACPPKASRAKSSLRRAGLGARWGRMACDGLAPAAAPGFSLPEGRVLLGVGPSRHGAANRSAFPSGAWPRLSGREPDRDVDPRRAGVFQPKSRRRSRAAPADPILADRASGDGARQPRRQPQPVLPDAKRRSGPVLDRLSTLRMGGRLFGDRDLPLFARALPGMAQDICSSTARRRVPRPDGLAGGGPPRPSVDRRGPSRQRFSLRRERRRAKMSGALPRHARPPAVTGAIKALRPHVENPRARLPCRPWARRVPPPCARRADGPNEGREVGEGR